MIINIVQAVFIRSGSVTARTVEDMFHLWSTDDMLNESVRHLQTKTVSECYRYFTNLMLQHSHNFNNFLRQLILKVYPHVCCIDRLIVLMEQLAEIEYNSSFHVYTNNVLFASVVSLHAALRPTQPAQPTVDAVSDAAHGRK